jgi:FkbM family methyltransferase
MSVKLHLKRVVGSILTAPVMGRAIALVTGDTFRSRGLRVDTSYPAVTPVVKAMLFWNMYESAEIRFVQRYLKPDRDVVELGSSLGVMACQIRARIEPERKLVCVEASPQLAPVIQKNLALNGFTGHTTVVTGAIDYSGAETVSFAEGGNTLQGQKAEAGAQTTSTPAVTLEKLLADHQINDYALVCDIEGAEAGIIFQGQGSLRSCRQIVIELHDAECNGRRVSVDEMADALVQQHGFRQVDRYGTVCVFDRS